jgi:hypothetical protein
VTTTGSTPPRTSIVHVISATLRDDVPEEAASDALERARRLREAPGAQSVIVGRTGPAVIVATWLGGRADLEPFAASRPHMEFVMRGLAPNITGMWSAGVEAASPPPAPDEVGALWAFAVRASDTAFEWQVRDVLTSLARLPAQVCAGPTFEERDRYRAGGVACIAPGAQSEFERALLECRAAWGDMSRHIVEAVAAVVP